VKVKRFSKQKDYQETACELPPLRVFKVQEHSTYQLQFLNISKANEADKEDQR